MKHAGRYNLVDEWFTYLFTEQPLDAGLHELAEWGKYLDPIDREEVRLRAVSSVQRALPPNAPAGSAKRLVDAALGVGAPEEALALAVV